MKKNKKKLKLTKLTVANLDRAKGGDIPCACHWTVTDGAWNRDHTRENPCAVTGAPGCEL